MLPNSDKISKPAKGRLFGLSVAELLALVRQSSFAHSEFQKRIDIALINHEQESRYGILIASFCPGDFVALFSLPDSISESRARLLSTAAVQEFSTIDHRCAPQWNRQKKISFRIYLGSLNQATITERVRTIKLGKYRGSAKFSTAFNPKAIHVEEKIIREVSLA